MEIKAAALVQMGRLHLLWQVMMKHSGCNKTNLLACVPAAGVRAGPVPVCLLTEATAGSETPSAQTPSC